MRDWLRRHMVCLFAAVALVVTGCGGGKTGVEPLAAARFDPASHTLELPLVRSGEATFVDVRLALDPDGNYRLLGSAGLAEGPQRAPDAELRPAVPLEAIVSAAEPLHLTVRRLHIGHDVFHSVGLELQGGRWRYTAHPQRSAALVPEDFVANPQLVATPDHVVVFASAPGVSSSARMRLQRRSYEFCLPAQSEGADTLALVASDGREVLRLRAGDSCATFHASAGVYEWRHTYGGLGSSRVMFLGRAPQPMARPMRQAAPTQEYWAVHATWQTTAGVAGQGFLTSVHSGNGPAGCLGSVGGFMQAEQATTLAATGISAALASSTTYARVLFDGLNFFQVALDANGNPATFGPSLACSGSKLGFMVDTRLPGALFIPSNMDAPRPLQVTTALEGWPYFGLTTDLRGTLIPSVLPSFGFPDGPAISGDGYGYSLQLVTDAAKAASYQRVLRYRPQGLGPTEPLQQGWVALFSASDCSGPAMLIEAPGLSSPGGNGLPGLLTGGSLGDFNGSIRLGSLTSATLYSATGYAGESHVINQSNCISQAQGWGTTGWKAASLQIHTNPVQLWFFERKCQSCNLAGIDFSGYRVTDVDLSGSNLTGAHFVGTDLSNANLQDTLLHGAVLDKSNLDSANLCRASLNALPTSAGLTTAAASLKGANLHNANLNQAHLENVNFDNANFYGDFQGNCSSDCSMMGCASANGAFINDAKFPGAFMAYADLTGAQGPANFANAVLVGALFNGANLAADTNNSTSFNGAFLMGADFSDAAVTPDMFSGAYYDSVNTACWAFVLPQVNLQFPAVPTMMTRTLNGVTDFKCTTSTAAITSTCVAITYQPPLNRQPAPITDGSQLPSGSVTSASCDAQPPLCAVDMTQPPGTQGYANQCWGPIPPLPSQAVRRR
jgi:uncharacterized protein YjbI with pentapeptide repeats